MDTSKWIQTARKTGIILLWILVCVGLLVSLAFVNKQESELKCTAVQIHIEPEVDLQFIDRARVLKVIRKDSAENKILGTRLKDLNVSEIERQLKADRFIQHAKVFTDMNGALHIHIEQREPIIRILNNKGESYYLDRTGMKMPLSPLFTARVAVASGNIFESGPGSDSLSSYVGRSLLKIATYVDKDAFWKAQIEQIFVNTQSEFDLVPKVGNHIIHFGNASDLDQKFGKLKLFYTEALNLLGWELYSEIDVRYKGQIVCKKR